MVSEHGVQSKVVNRCRYTFAHSHDKKKLNTAHVILVSIAFEIYTFGGFLHNSILSQLMNNRMLTINWMQIEKMSS